MYPLSTIKILNNRFTLTGFSRSAEATAFYIPEMDMMLDAGTVVTTTKFRRLFVTHSHSDHSFQIPWMYSPSSPAPMDIYVPNESLPHFNAYLTSAQLLNDHGDEKAFATCTRRYTLHGVSEKQIIDLDRSYRVEIINCHHTIPCVGYAFYEKRSKLKSDYSHLSGKQIQELKKQGVEITEQISIPLFAFLGDTTPDVFAAGSYSARVLLDQMPVIICECTFLEGEQSNEKGHTHWSALKPIIEQHPHITFVLIHFSLKYRRQELQNFFDNQSLKNVIPFIGDFQ
jgi:ribonuclease Z